MSIRVSLRIALLAMLAGVPLLTLLSQAQLNELNFHCVASSANAKTAEELNSFLEICNQALKETDLEADQRALLLASRADIKGALGNSVGALDDLTSSIALLTAADPLRAHVLTSRSMRYVYIGDIKKAISDADAALTDDPEHWWAFYARGFANSRLGDLASAVKDYDIFVKQLPNEPDGYNNRAYAHLRLGDLDKAQADIERAVVLAPKIGMYRHSLGEIQALRGDLEQARLSWITACHDTDQHVRYAWKRSLKKQGLYAGELDQSCGQELITAFEECLRKRCLLATEDFKLSK